VLRIAVFSDVHGNLAALRAVLAAIDCQRPVQLIVVAGDLVAPAGARPAETFDLLVERGCVLLLGNHDQLLWAPFAEELSGPFAKTVREQIPWAVSQLGGQRLDQLRRLPHQLRLSPAPGQDLLIVHASVSDPLHGHAATAESTDDELRLRYGGANARAIAFGHYHQPFTREWNGVLLANVASVSLPKDDAPLAAYSIFEWDGDWAVRQYRVPYDVTEEAAAIAARGLPQ
jgi:predicted phosphodiesterase